MATKDQFDEAVSTWLEKSAPPHLPERALAATFERTRRSRQQRGWRALLGGKSMPRLAAALCTAAVVVAATALALNLDPDLPGVGVASPSAGASALPSAVASGGMWPQTSLEELRQAQERVDAGDSAYAWQGGADYYQPGQNHPHSDEFFARFLREELGWEEFRWDEALPHLDAGDVVYVRCAAGGTNPLYADDPEGGCAPTLDELRYETVKINVAQLVREGPRGIWVVTGWRMIEPFEQVAPPSDAEITASLGAFLQARIDGAGAEDLADVSENDQNADERVEAIPLLYATSNGAPFERSEFELVEGPVWPTGWTKFEVRLFAGDGKTAVEQAFSMTRDETGRLRLAYEPEPGGPGTTENGKAVPVTYGFLDGEVTYRAAYPLEPSQDGYRDRDRLAIVGLLPDDDAPRRVLLMLADPRSIGPDCVEAPAPADAEALARSIQSNPDLEATAPVAVTIGGISALQMDVFLAPGASSCSWSEYGTSGRGPLLLEHAPFVAQTFVGDRARLYLFDLPGGSARVLAMVTITDDDSFETVLEWAKPIVDSIEFHAR